MKLGKTSKLVEGAVRPNPQGRNKRCVWQPKYSNAGYEIIVNNKNGENIFKAGNIPYAEIIKCFGHWFNGEQHPKGTTWRIPTQSFPEAHFAVFPEALIEIPILAGCPQYICKKCGVAREKIFKETKVYHRKRGYKSKFASGEEYGGKFYADSYDNIKTPIGYTDCGCNAGWRSGIILDPFIGSGTTGVVARKLGRDFVGIELQKKYIPMAHKRIMAVPANLFKEAK